MKDIEYDELTGITTKIEYHDDMKVKVTQSQDLSAAVDYAAQRRRFDKPVNKETWNHYAIIPAIVMHEMYQKGIDVAHDAKAAFDFINTHYPALKLTDRWHDSRKAKRDGRIVIK